MALIPQGILGPFSGRVGSVVGCICTTRSFYIRSLPRHYHDARTPEQLRNREKLKLLMEFLSAAKSFVNKHLEHLAEGQTATNVATALNFHRAFGESGGLQYGNVLLSKGSCAGLEGLVVLREGDSVVMGWNRRGVLGEVMDRVSVMIYNAMRKESVTKLEAAYRMDGRLEMRLPGGWRGEDVHVYVGVGDGYGITASETQYAMLHGAVAEVAAVKSVGTEIGETRWERGKNGEDLDLLEKEQSATKVVLESGQDGGKLPPGGD